jgi:alanyl-tRNA synthetase
MQSNEIRTRFLKFFENRGHKIIPSASLVPENDPSVLFNTAGMQPLVPYLLGQEHPMGKRIADVQKCVRTGDLDDIGDNRHFSFFEMMGNWSLGAYFKEEAIEYSYKFLTNGDNEKEGDKGLGLGVNRLFITVFSGDEYSKQDDESVEIWKKQGIPEDRIYFLPAEDNWWGAGDTGPCGPCSEMFYDMEGKFVGQNISREKFIEECKKETIIEIWNDVFMAYNKQVKDEHKLEYQELKLKGLPIPKTFYFLSDLPNKNIDTGAGLERITAVMQGKKTAYDTDLFESVAAFLIPVPADMRKKRIIADHIRTSVFLIADGVIPSNKDQGYVLRRLLRRAIFCYTNRKINKEEVSTLVDLISIKYGDVYEKIKENSHFIKNVINDEVNKFTQTLENGLKEFEKGIDPFILATTYGFPIELTEELAQEKGIKIDREDFNKKMAEHQKLSQTASAGMFKGGLANHNEKTVRLHTAHHLLLAALQEVVSPEIKQRGSNITEERLRIDFVCDHKLTDEEKQKVEDLVNQKIKSGLNVVRREMPLTEAEKIGAQMEFGAKYPETVSVYFVEDEKGSIFSKEFCGGPHVANTGELGHFKIQKEEAVSAGIRRIKAILE